VLDCKACGMEVHWVQGISMADAPHWGASATGTARGACGVASRALIDCEEDRTLRAVLVGMLRENDRT